MEREALARVGQRTLRAFLMAHPAGTSPLWLANQLGHSGPWLQSRARRDGLDSRLKTTTALERLTATAAAAGYPEPARYLRQRYETGLTMTQLQKKTGLHSHHVAALLRQAGAVRRDHPAIAERLALDRIGWTGSLGEYDIARDRAGLSIQKMGWELGRSDVWVTRRLRAGGYGHLIRPPGHRK